MKWKVESVNAAATEKLAEQIGARLKGGEIIELISDLGGGKTTLVRGLVRGAGSSAHVSSPTFTISNIYDAPNFKIHHFDFYRVPEPGLIAHELHDVLQDPRAVVVMEWGAMLRGVLPKNHLSIEIEKINEDGRSLAADYTPELGYLLEGLK